jgi:hypothetical protein
LKKLLPKSSYTITKRSEKLKNILALCNTSGGVTAKSAISLAASQRLEAARVGYSSWSSLAGRTSLSMPQVQIITALTTIAYYSFSIPESAVAQPGQRKLAGLPEWAAATLVRDFQPLAFFIHESTPYDP